MTCPGKHYFSEGSSWLKAVESEAKHAAFERSYIEGLNYKSDTYLRAAQAVLKEVGVDETIPGREQRLGVLEGGNISRTLVSKPIALGEDGEAPFARIMHTEQRKLSLLGRIALPIIRRRAYSDQQTAGISYYDDSGYWNAVDTPHLSVSTFSVIEQLIDSDDLARSIDDFGHALAQIATSNNISLTLRTER